MSLNKIVAITSILMLLTTFLYLYDAKLFLEDRYAWHNHTVRDVWETNDPDSVLNHIYLMREINPDSSETFILEGLLEIHKGDLMQASELSNYKNTTPTLTQNLVIAKINIYEMEFDDTRKILLDNIKQYPSDYRSYALLSYVDLCRNDLNEVSLDIEKAYPLMPKEKNQYTNILGMVSHYMDKLESGDKYNHNYVLDYIIV